MPDVRDIMIEEDCTLEEANEIWIDAQASAFDRWKDEAKEAGTYLNPLVRRDA